MSTDLAAVYLKAADIIRTNGHYKGAYFEPSPESGVGIQPHPHECRVCIAGALSIALSGDPTPDRDQTLAREYFDTIADSFAERLPAPGNLLDAPVARLAAWNDADERTQDDVIAALESAAKVVAA